MCKFDLLYEQVVEAMDRRSFLKFLGKTPAAAAMQGVVSNVPQAPSLLGSAIKLMKMFKPIGFGIYNLPTGNINLSPTSYGNMSVAVSDLKNQLLKVAFNNKKLISVPGLYDITNNTIESLDTATNDFAHMQASLDDGNEYYNAQNLHQSAYDENVTDAQISIHKALLLIKLLGTSNPNFEKALKNEFNVDLNDPEYTEEIKDVVDSDINRQDSRSEDLANQNRELQDELNKNAKKDYQKKLTKQKRKQGRKKIKEREAKKGLKQDWKEKQTNYPRFDRAGGSEDVGYAQTYESFFIENYADGKKPGRKGLAKRSGVNCKQSVTKLRKIAKKSSGERKRMAHWCANMKSGKKKAKK